MPWTRQQVKFLLSKGSPLDPEEKTKMQTELHADPAMGHMKKGYKKGLAAGQARRNSSGK